MISVFPTPYPDELLYSIFARYHTWSHNLSPEHTCKDLFGRVTYAAPELYSNLTALCDRLHGNTCTPEQFIKKHTLLPLYEPFMPQERVKKLIGLMKKSNSGADIARISGIFKYALRAPRFLLYCPACLKEDETRYGEPYWHRSHQAVGVHICHIHNAWLQESNISILEQRDRRAYFCPDERLLQKENGLFHDWKNIGHYLDITKSVNWLLNNEAHAIGPDEIQQRYVYLLRGKGLTTLSGRVNLNELFQQVVNFFGEDFLEKMNSPIDPQDKDNWITSLIRRPKKTVHPLRHILLMRFLDISPENFMELKPEKFQPFGDGPWPCLNPAAHHHSQFVIKECTIKRSNYTKGPVGIFMCSCGFSYSRLGPGKEQQDKYRFDNIISYGPVWEKELQRLALEEKKSFREIGKILNICHHTVKAQLERLGNNPDISGDGDADHKKREKCRRYLLTLMSRNSAITRNELRSKAVAEFNWLYRNDKEWFSKNLPAPQPNIKNLKMSVDWTERDNGLCSKISSAAEQIKNQHGKPVRITMKEIGKITGVKWLLSKRLEKLPKINAELEKIIESIEDFQIRKVHYAAEQLAEKGEPLRVWKILNKAGLNGRYSKRVFEEIEKLLASNMLHEEQLSFF